MDTILPKIQKKPKVENLSSFKNQVSTKKPSRIENQANYKQFILGNMGK